MNKKQTLLIFGIALIGILIYIILPDDAPLTSTSEIAGDSQTVKDQNTTIQQTRTEYHPGTVNPDEDKALPAGVNPVFHDAPKVQSMWMKRGTDIVLKNHPEADTADFKKIFFHRGFKARPVTCGEVQFRTQGEIISEYQRFIYTGLQSTYLENDVENFHIFWSKMCEQTLDEYFDIQEEKNQQMLEKSDN